ncbi:MAG: ABC transporter ATP-binding protein [Candidatus Competibacteraceae bacterium]
MAQATMTGDSTYQRYRRLLRYPLQQWPTLLVILALTILSSSTAALQPWPMKLLVDYGLGDSQLPAWLYSYLPTAPSVVKRSGLIIAAAVASLALYALNSSLSIGLNWAWTTAGQRMVYDLAAGLFHRLQRLSLSFHNRYPVGDSLSRLMGDSYCVYTLLDGLLVAPLHQLLILITIGLVAWRLDPTLAVVTFSVAPPLALAMVYFAPRLKQRARSSREVEVRLASFVHQVLTALPVVQAFTAERRNRETYLDLAEAGVVLKQRNELLQRIFGSFNGLVTSVVLATVFYLGGRQVLAGTMPLGSLLVVLAYAQSILDACKNLFGTYGSLKSVEASMDRVLEILDSSDSVEDRPGARELPGLRSPAGIRIHLEAINFGYEPGRAVLKGIDLEAGPGETIALVGPTGAGKSTLASLIPRLYDPWQGRVTFDGVDIREFKLDSLRRRVALVLQEPFLLPLTVAENIAYGRPSAAYEDIVAAAVAARAHEFIQRLPQGYHTVIGERGATLSGGEKQRLSIARAFLKDAPVLILDEPTAALDAHTETLLMEALERLLAGRTTFIIAHRLSTVQRADRIVVLENGRIVEQGSPKDLLATDGSYHRLHALPLSAGSGG